MFHIGFILGVITSAHLPLGWSATGPHSSLELLPDTAQVGLEYALHST